MSFHSVVIQKLLNANAHIGRRVTSNHFKIFSEGTRNGVSIVDADKTLICLRNACDFIGHLSRNNARLLFVNTNSLFDEIIAQMTKTIGIKHDTTWRLGGFLTNSSSPRRFRGRNKKFNICAPEAPDCIVIFDTESKSSVIKEANRLQIPVVGLVDSSMPWETYSKITYPVPANDSVEFVYMFCNLITKTILKERKEAMAERGEEAVIGGDVELDGLTNQSTDKFVLPYEELSAIPEDVSETKALLDKLVIVRFNGDLGTTIGFSGPKSTMEIIDGLTCLDLTINQIEALNTKYGTNIPLYVVNTVDAHRKVLEFLKKHPNKNIHSIQESITDLKEASKFAPRSAKGQDSKDEMNSFNIAQAILPLVNSGRLDILSSQGKEYILLLGSDNLGCVIDPKILNYLGQNDIELCLEVTPKSSVREETQHSQDEAKTPILTPKKDWRFTDTMWMSIQSMEKLVAKDSLTISKIFDQHFAISVPNARYLPVEATSDLFLLQSDLYTFIEDKLTRNTTRDNPTDPSIQLGPVFRNVNDFKERFKSIPSIVGLDSLKVTGDVWFGAGITLKGEVNIHAGPGARIVIPDGAVLENKTITSQEGIGEISS
ncbi:UTP--glucose-1-phosphate uridylyltransferase 1-like [Salvia splendens]|uniref:UTP--glucose-1-phosphate uridylyltransferase 1-like n=1 Tax=Salvia splendens TaxID=180675 RepID=UPI001C25C9FD|nr:UTP--glucose-1-phosphate uridylyltransferase 1-like [Salvia splendens]